MKLNLGLLSLLGLLPLAAHAGGEDLTAGTELMSKLVIPTCQAFMAEKKTYETAIMPPEFRSLLEESYKKASSHLSEASKAVLTQKYVALSTQEKISLKDWNQFHLGIAHLGTQNGGPPAGSVNDFSPVPCKAVNKEDSFDEVSRKLEQCLKETGSGHFELREPFKFFNLPPLPSRCSIAVYHDLGIEPMTHAFINGIYPNGVSVTPAIADGTEFTSLGFFMHDVLHSYIDSSVRGRAIVLAQVPFDEKKLREAFDSKEEVFAAMPLNRVSPREVSFLSEVVSKLGPKERRRIYTLYFCLSHESSPLQFEAHLVDVCAGARELKDKKFDFDKFTNFFLAGQFFLKRQGLGGLLPTQVKEELNSIPGSLWENSEQRETVIKKYFAEMKDTLCSAWSDYLKTQAAHVPGEIARLSSQLQSASLSSHSPAVVDHAGAKPSTDAGAVAGATRPSSPSALSAK